MLITLMMLLTLIQSCRNRNGQEQPKELEDREQLSVYLADAIEIDNKLYIPLEGSGCFSRNYRIDNGFVGPISEEITLDIRECHKIVGFAPSEYGNLATWLENMRIWLIGFKRKSK